MRNRRKATLNNASITVQYGKLIHYIQTCKFAFNSITHVWPFVSSIF